MSVVLGASTCRARPTYAGTVVSARDATAGGQSISGANVCLDSGQDILRGRPCLHYARATVPLIVLICATGHAYPFVVPVGELFDQPDDIRRRRVTGSIVGRTPVA